MTSSKPSQYIKGWVEFYKLKFKVTPDVLIPRPETELLVDAILNILRESKANREVTILDLGTGAGNIAISLAKNLSHLRGVTILATDISEKALKVAKQNAKLHGVENKITFLQGNLLDIARSDSEEGSCRVAGGAIVTRMHGGIPSWQDPDIIVTNLPYIPSARIPYLDSSVKDFEPHIALDGGEDGFELYRKLFKQINEKNWKPKLIIGEIDYTHGELAINEAYKYFPWAETEIKYDLAHMQRILTINSSSEKPAKLLK